MNKEKTMNKEKNYEQDRENQECAEKVLLH